MLDDDLSNCNEADTCRRLVTPRLIKAGWDDEPHSFTEQKTFTDGRIIVVGDKPKRRPPPKLDALMPSILDRAFRGEL
jgi:type I restriction enzyme R subunit